jgi:hypothetical protein
MKRDYVGKAKYYDWMTLVKYEERDFARCKKKFNHLKREYKQYS